MTWLLAMIVLLLIATWVLLPLTQVSQLGFQLRTINNRKSLQDLREEKASLLLALRELDFDYEMEKLSSADYKALRTKYEGKAVSVLKELEKKEKQWRNMQDAIDQEVQQRMNTIAKADR